MRQSAPRLLVALALLPSLLLPAAVGAQSAAISGRVTSGGGAPLAGAVVELPRLSLTTVTSDAGLYRLVVPLEAATSGREDSLRVRRLGFGPRLVRFTLAAGDNVVDVTLTEQAVALDEMVVTGTAGSQERRAQGASIATIDAAAVTQAAPIQNVEQLLQGRVPGVNISQANGASGAPNVVRIRGVSSISLSNEPLIFIDGVRVDNRNLDPTLQGAGFNTLSSLAPGDVESVEVVKGPAAATLYGADASAGVIQIITKRGRVGSTRFTQSITSELATIRPNWDPPANFARCPAELVGADSPNPLCRGQAVGALIADNPLVRDRMLRDGSARSITWAGRGGGENYGYFLSYGYLDENGTLAMDGLEKQSGRLSFTFVPRPNLTVDAGLGVARDVARQAYNGNHPYSTLLGLVGNPLTVGTGVDGWFFSPAAGLQNIESALRTTRFTPTVTAKYSPLGWFTNRLTLGADVSRNQYRQFFPKNDQGWYPYLNGDDGRIEEIRDNHDIYTLDYLGNARVPLGARGHWVSDLSIGAQLISRSADALGAVGQGLVTNGTNTVSSATTVTSTGTRWEQRSVGFLGQLQLGYRDRLFVQVGARVDGNSAFGDANEYFFLPKAGVSYVLSQEAFWQRAVPWVNTLRLRAAYGTTGRSPTPGASLQTYDAGTFVVSPGVAGAGVVPLNPGNTALKAERGTELEGGLDAGFWHDRIGLELTAFSKVTTDLLLRRPIAPSFGFTDLPFANVGEVRNRGVEAALRASIVATSRFAWESRVSVSTLHNELTDLGGVAPFATGFGNENQYREGRQLGAFFSVRVHRVDEAAGVAIVSDTAEFIGNSLPTHEGALSTDLTFFRHLRITGLLEWRGGHRKFNTTAWFRETQVPVGERAQKADELPTPTRLRLFGPFVTEDGTPVNPAAVLDSYMEDASFVRLRELSATLSLPTRWARAVRASGVSITAGGRNLGLWTDYSGPDPEAISFVPSTGVFYNADFVSMPQPRRFYARLNLEF